MKKKQVCFAGCAQTLSQGNSTKRQNQTLSKIATTLKFYDCAHHFKRLGLGCAVKSGKLGNKNIQQRTSSTQKENIKLRKTQARIFF